jgi:hypothetical protein
VDSEVAGHGPPVIRGADLTRHALLQQSISQLPRVQDRLLALMWLLADSRGIASEERDPCCCR